MVNRLALALLLFIGAAFPLSAQRWSLSTNALDYADFGTLNLEGGVAAGRHWSLTAVAKYNPFSFEGEKGTFQARQRLFGAGVRFWPWHVFSGWWAAARLQYQEYNRGGIRELSTDEGDRYGLGLSGGYSYMIHPHLNLDVGAGFWGGYDRYVRYSCPVCGLTESSGEKAFILPSDLMLSLVYVF
ncbi:MAG: DUF3575 domain-containing protein [Bacteroidales bacterium]|nr:DUF3575 domain-containing protein [Bacteroidales bacterium]